VIFNDATGMKTRSLGKRYSSTVRSSLLLLKGLAIVNIISRGIRIDPYCEDFEQAEKCFESGAWRGQALKAPLNLCRYDSWF
jgi:hypothetical protein